nr:GIY-YIG nuclease family protein [uncultured Peptostreptococcus sp.]
MFYTYLLRCKDNSLYCGYTGNVERRMKEHKIGSGSKYVKAKGYMKLEFYLSVKSRSEAMKFESYIKSLPKKEKEKLVSGDSFVLKKLGISYTICMCKDLNEY